MGSNLDTTSEIEAGIRHTTGIEVGTQQIGCFINERYLLSMLMFKGKPKNEVDLFFSDKFWVYIYMHSNHFRQYTGDNMKHLHNVVNLCCSILSTHIKEGKFIDFRLSLDDEYDSRFNNLFTFIDDEHENRVTESSPLMFYTDIPEEIKPITNSVKDLSEISEFIKKKLFPKSVDHNSITIDMKSIDPESNRIMAFKPFISQSDVVALNTLFKIDDTELTKCFDSYPFMKFATLLELIHENPDSDQGYIEIQIEPSKKPVSSYKFTEFYEFIDGEYSKTPILNNTQIYHIKTTKTEIFFQDKDTGITHQLILILAEHLMRIKRNDITFYSRKVDDTELITDLLNFFIFTLHMSKDQMQAFASYVNVKCDGYVLGFLDDIIRYN